MSRRGKKKQKSMEEMTNEEGFQKDWTRNCDTCSEQPVVKATGLCGPCTFGDAETAGGNW